MDRQRQPGAPDRGSGSPGVRLHREQPRPRSSVRGWAEIVLGAWFLVLGPSLVLGPWSMVPVPGSRDHGVRTKDGPRTKARVLRTNVKLYPLGQRQVVRVVDGVRDAAHVLFPGVAARFAAAARLLLTTERATDLRA